MANTRELRRRIKSIKSTAQITKAMQMVAASKMKKAQNQALNGRPYTFNLSFALSKLLTAKIESHQLLTGNDSKSTGVVLLSTDKGLNGALNTNLFRLIAADFLSADIKFYTVGKKGRNFIARLGKNLLADFANSDIITFRQAMQLSKLVIDAFKQKEIGEAFIVYPQFISTLRQQPVKTKILPIDYQELINSITSELEKQNKEEAEKEFLFEPNISQLLDYLLLHFVQIKIYQALLETKASEHSATMIAMQNATDNALELVDDLKLTYNQTRQDSITKELLEITTATIAME